MSLWVVAYCTKPLAAFEDAVESALDVADFASMAEWQSLDEDVGYAAEDSLRYERFAEAGRRVVLVRYKHHEKGDTFVRCDHHADPAFVKEDVEGRLEEDPPARVRDVLSRAVETVAFDLKTSDWDGMGLPIAFYTAMELAKPTLGDGLVLVEDEWWDPKTFERVP